MARQIIDIGIQGNDGTGDSIRESFRKVNDNFQQLFSIFGSGETIAFTDLDGTPDELFDGQVLVAQEDGDGVVIKAKILVGGEGIDIDLTSDPNQITISGGGGDLFRDPKPTLGNHLNAANYSIGLVADPETYVQSFNDVYFSGSKVATADDFVITRGYADRRYIQAGGVSSPGSVGNKVLIRNEPENSDSYSFIIEDWEEGYAVINRGEDTENPGPGHGFNTSINGAGVIYSATGTPVLTEPSITLKTVYYLRYYDEYKLGIYETAQDARAGTNRLEVNVESNISKEARGEEKFTDVLYDETIPGFWLSNEALPRKSVVRRDGDEMTGLLYLSDHPGNFQGLGTPNGPSDLQAATKLYVDQSSFASTINIFVSNDGDDEQLELPLEKRGRSLAYAFRTVNRACKRAEELINNSLFEPGPYRQALTYGVDNLCFLNESLVVPDTNPPRRTLLINSNGQGVNQSIDPTNRDLREGSIIKGLYSGATGKVLSYGGTIGINDQYLVELLHTISDKTNFETNFINAAKLITDNKNFIAEEVYQYAISTKPILIAGLTTEEQEIFKSNFLRDIPNNILNSVILDIKFGGNNQSLKSSELYWIENQRYLDEKFYNTANINDNSGIGKNSILYIKLLLEKILNNEILTTVAVPPNPTVEQSLSKRSTETQVTAQPSTPIESRSVTISNRLLDSILDVYESGLNGSETPLDFLTDEPLEYGQPVSELQISIRVESGIYYEQLPIRVPTNVSIKGDEFRRVIIRPAFGESQSDWARIKFFRDDQFDGITRTWNSGPYVNGTEATTTLTLSQENNNNLEIGSYLKVISGPGTGELNPLTQVIDKPNSTTIVINYPVITSLVNATVRGLTETGLAPTGNKFAYHYLTDPDNSLSRPKDNRNMDVFLLNDATIIRNLTCQGHGGFMCVLDPEGQIQTKSPYIQTASSLSASLNKKRFAGGMYIDGFCGNIPATITNKIDAFELSVSGLNIRKPQVPSAFFINGVQYQVNRIDNYNQLLGTATIYLDLGANPDANGIPQGFTQTVVSGDTNTYVNIILETAGNKSMLANDYTQVNDLAYGAIATNNGLSELVSVFSYYCWTSYYSVNGGQIRSTQGNSSYGEYGLRATGKDFNEVPDTVSLENNTLQIARIYKKESLAGKNLKDDIAVYIEGYDFIPDNISEIEIDHSNTRSSLVSASLTLNNGGSGYAVGQTLKISGGTTFLGLDTPTLIRIDGVSGTAITAFTILNPGDYSVAPSNALKNEQILNTEYNTPGSGSGIGATFRGTYLGITNIYEVNSVERTNELGDGFVNGGATTQLPILKLNLRSNTNSGLYSNLEDNQYVIVRGLQNFQFNQVEEIKPVRPSTALEFTSAEESGEVYRTLTYNLINSVGDILNPLGQPQDKAILTFDTSYDYISLETNISKLTDVDYAESGSGKTMGSRVGDTRIAVKQTDTRDIARLNSGKMLFGRNGILHRILSYTAENGAQSAYITIQNINQGQGSLASTVTPGINEAFNTAEQTRIKAGIEKGAQASITVRISTCRVSGHDFLDVGTGGFVTTNYPNNIYGAPTQPKNQSKEVIEEGEGRVFYVSTDQDGIFRVGKFFTVDQGTGTVSFSASIALSNLDGIGFKRGTTVKEFSTDDSMTDAANDTVPTESAIVGYISRRLGISPNGSIVPSEQRIPEGTGFLPVNGSIAMTGNLDMNSQRIVNLANFDSDSDAATRGYVKTSISEINGIDKISGVSIDNPQENQTFLYNGSAWINSLLKNKSLDQFAGISQNKIYLNFAKTIASGDVPQTTAIQLGQLVVGKRYKINNLGNTTEAQWQAAGVEGTPIVGLEFQAKATTTGSGTVILLDDVQASLGLASFNNTNFETNSYGWVSIKNQGISYSKIQNVTSMKILGNLTNSATSIQEVSSGDILKEGINNEITLYDLTSNVISLRRNKIKSDAIFIYESQTSPSTTGTIVYNDIPAVALTGSGNGARFKVSRNGTTYTITEVTYGGHGYLENNQLLIDGSLIGGVSGVNDLIVRIGTGGIDTTTSLGINKVSINAQPSSIISTDSNKNLGNVVNRFNTVFSTNLNASETITSKNLSVSEYVKTGIDSNVTATGTTSASAYAISKSVTIVNNGGANTGLRLPQGSTTESLRVIIRNNLGSSINIYPPDGGTINALDPNIAYTLLENSSLEFFSVNQLKWYNLSGTFA